MSFHNLRTKSLLNKKTIWLTLLSLSVMFSLLTLKSFPFLHSDEPWLSGLAREISLSGSFASTEPFFDLYPRHPHALKIIFHSLQILFMHWGGYNYLSFRLMSFFAGLLCLFLFYRINTKLLPHPLLAFGMTTLLSVNIQFIYASHFARQEILLLAILCGSILLLLRKGRGTVVPSAMLIGLGIGFHPNALIIFLASLAFLFSQFLFESRKARDLYIFCGIFLAWGIFFLSLSFYFNSNFISDYLSFGKSLGVTSGLAQKFQGFFSYYAKIFLRISGTYYLPEIRVEFLFALFIIIFSSGKIFFYGLSKKNHKTIAALLLSLLGLNLGIILIGRYNATSIIFNIPLLLLLLGQILPGKIKERNNLLAILVMFSLLGSLYNIIPEVRSRDSYQDYLNAVSSYVSPEAKVLANLNLEYYFENGKLLDYRNLSHLPENNLSFSTYLAQRKIEYIILPQEIETIYQERPRWNDLYGNPHYYYEELEAFLKESCTLLGEFHAPTYAMRLVFYMPQKEGWVRVYRIDNY